MLKSSHQIPIPPGDIAHACLTSMTPDAHSRSTSSIDWCRTPSNTPSACPKDFSTLTLSPNPQEELLCLLSNVNNGRCFRLFVSIFAVKARVMLCGVSPRFVIWMMYEEDVAWGYRWSWPRFSKEKCTNVTLWICIFWWGCSSLCPELKYSEWTEGYEWKANHHCRFWSWFVIVPKILGSQYIQSLSSSISLVEKQEDWPLFFAMASTYQPGSAKLKITAPPPGHWHTCISFVISLKTETQIGSYIQLGL